MLAVEAPGAPRPTLEVAATTLARVEAADRALAEVDRAVAEGGKELSAYLGSGAVPFERLRQDLRGWVHSSLKALEQLGLTPMSAARIEESLADRSTRVQVSVATLVASTEWQSVKERIAAALAPFPEAMQAVQKALQEAEGS